MNLLTFKFSTAIIALSFATISAFASDVCCKDLLLLPKTRSNFNSAIRFNTPSVRPVDELRNMDLPTEAPQIFTLKDSLIFKAPTLVTDITLTELPVENLALTTLVKILKFATPGFEAQLHDATAL